MAARLLHASDGFGRPWARADDDDGFAPPVPLPGELGQQHSTQRDQDEAQEEGNRERHARYMGGSFNAKDTAASRRKLEAVTYDWRRSVSTGPSPKPGYSPATA